MVFPFLCLPLEIRTPIYRYSLPYSKQDRRKGQSSRFITRAEEDLIRWYNGICPSILFANRQTFLEACDVLYHENTFAIYVRHPRQPRLPMNESRADDHSFVHISWKHRSWSHPRNHKISLAVLQNHSHFSRICRVHINLPPLNDLLAADMYMRTTSYASHYGLSAWVEKLRLSDGQPSEPDQERMDYINMSKGPVDEVAELVQKLLRINELVIFLNSEKYEVAFIEYVISGLLQLRGVHHAQLLYRAKEFLYTADDEWTFLRVAMMEPRLRDLERQLESAPSTQVSEKVPGLSPGALEMLEMLDTMRRRLLLIRQLRPTFLDSNVDTTLPALGNIMAE